MVYTLQLYCCCFIIGLINSINREIQRRKRRSRRRRRRGRGCLCVVVDGSVDFDAAEYCVFVSSFDWFGFDRWKLHLDVFHAFHLTGHGTWRFNSSVRRRASCHIEIGSLTDLRRIKWRAAGGSCCRLIHPHVFRTLNIYKRKNQLQIIGYNLVTVDMTFEN